MGRWLQSKGTEIYRFPCLLSNPAAVETSAPSPELHDDRRAVLGYLTTPIAFTAYLLIVWIALIGPLVVHPLRPDEYKHVRVHLLAYFAFTSVLEVVLVYYWLWVGYTVRMSSRIGHITRHVDTTEELFRTYHMRYGDIFKIAGAQAGSSSDD